MVMTVNAAADSGRIEENEDGTQSTIDTYIVRNPASRLEALQAVAGTAVGSAHPSLTGFYVTGRNATPLDAADVGDDDVTYKLTVNYATVPPASAQPVSVERGSVQVRTQPVTIKKIIADSAPTVYGTNAADYGRLIGVSIDPPGVQGIDINIPAFAVSIRKYFQTSFGGDESPPGWPTLLDLAGKYNTHDFEPLPGVVFAPGEALFVGPTLARTFTTASDEYVEYGYDFLVYKNTTEAVTVTKDDGSTETQNVVKKGWQGIWTDLRKIVTTSSNLELKVAIRGVYVCDVYGSGDLEDLNYRLTDPVVGEALFYRSFNAGSYVDAL